MAPRHSLKLVLLATVLACGILGAHSARSLGSMRKHSLKSRMLKQDDPEAVPEPVVTFDGFASVWDYIQSEPDMSTVATLLNATGLAPALQNGSDVLTVALPFNYAFTLLFDQLGTNLTTILHEEALLNYTRSILLYHVMLDASYDVDYLYNVTSDAQTVELPTALGAKLSLLQTFGTGMLVFRDLMGNNGNALYYTPAGNGSVYVIDSVMLPVMPETVQDLLTMTNATLGLFHRALELCGYSGMINDNATKATFFAPNNFAFETLAYALGMSIDTLFSEDKNSLLCNVVSCHVVSNDAYSIFQLLPVDDVPVEVSPEYPGSSLTFTPDVITQLLLVVGEGTLDGANTTVVHWDMIGGSSFVQEINTVLVPNDLPQDSTDMGLMALMAALMALTAALMAPMAALMALTAALMALMAALMALTAALMALTAALMALTAALMALTAALMALTAALVARMATLMARTATLMARTAALMALATMTPPQAQALSPAVCHGSAAVTAAETARVAVCKYLYCSSCSDMCTSYAAQLMRGVGLCIQACVCTM
eukprot:CAMPEP_0202920128 /NCGR_PEP_ID=MMETSP1392-20130828/76696_1 /ASSEMBLY_ACC=CAM_ASM_000868 /TAXON_ID=225041 /ORGANISM="Chlamydomonas chlamydogama, Strain SAG 11-48b" /LENGTH=543 /DNA_ID=CAMNT_0049613611 /DNA_START=87 /DNA_END=1720 /DNA_ORIENTATION=-